MPDTRRKPIHRLDDTPGRPDPDRPHYGYGTHMEDLLADGSGPEPTGEQLKATQRSGEGSPEVEAERTHTDPETGETVLPESVQDAHALSEAAFERAIQAGAPAADGAVSRADVVAERQADLSLDGVGRNQPEEQVELVRAVDLPGTGIDPGRKFFDGAYGPPGDGAPVALPSGGAKHHLGAPWPPPLAHTAQAPSASPEPGPEPDQQWHPPQPITFADHDAAVRGTVDEASIPPTEPPPVTETDPPPEAGTASKRRAEEKRRRPEEDGA